ncbi:Serine/threonine-protein kinase SMG1-like protein [Dinothrombium tinctorium]|uniref:non-specific serine/threonine protein kinase n=1 Tax=Dinothrombium tinctorium TaxID=1965070 RepID=A0A3S3PH58_9ACAR|nr:Serine/threonine-protein kinase SMG1-like protein [Dinothrombium tinctorium]RWS15177.1 Serine/threonine-protein kinase SMG1-like protein [Dinothrombium tinctorium]RWS15191.1 Serine/threonine-protein kinase SMG1-like protein [Dinothrombium tinctorium]
MSSYVNRNERQPNTDSIRCDQESSDGQSNGSISGRTLFDAYGRSNSSHTYSSRSFVARRPINNCESEAENNAKNRNDISSLSSLKNNGYGLDVVVKVPNNASFTSGGSDNSPLKSLRILLRQFDTGEKRQWPNYLQDLTKLFSTSSFIKAANEKPGRVIDDVTRVFTRVLTTKLFPDIIQQMIVCLSTFSSALGYNCRELFNWIFDLYYDSVPDETRLVLLKSLVMIIDNGGKGLSDNMPALLNKVKRALEEADTCELLLGITDIFLATSKNYSSMLQAHFRDVVDILIGWHIDSSQSPVVTQTLAKALISFNFFWINDLDFSLTLLGQFLEDFEAYFDELMENEKSIGFQPKSPKSRNVNGNSQLSSDERLAKMASLVRVYITVLQSLGEYASPERNTAISWDFIVNSLRSILMSVNCTIRLKPFEPLIIATNECAIFALELMSGHEQVLIESVTEQLLLYLQSVQSLLVDVNDAFIITTLQLMTKIVKEVNVNLPVEFISNILMPSSEFQKLRFMPSSKILMALYELHHSILGLKNIPLLEEAYKCFLMDLQIAYSILLSKPINFIQGEHQVENVSYSSEEAVIAVTSALISLTEIATTKHSLIGMWALKPTFFDLIIQHLDPSNDILTANYPSIQYSLIYILYSHSSKHRHFIPNSSLLSNPMSSSLASNASPIATSFSASIIASPSSGHLTKILNLLSALLRKQQLKRNSCLLVMNWIIEIISCAQSHLNTFCATKEMSDLLELVALYAFSPDITLCLKSCQAFEMVLKSVEDFSMVKILIHYFSACLMHIGHSNGEIRTAYLNLFAILPLNCYSQIDTLWKSSKSDFIFPEDIKTAKFMLMKREPSSTFSNICFRTIVAFVLENPTLDANEKWLQRLFHICLNEENPIKSQMPASAKNGSEIKNQEKIIATFDNNENALVFWACWEIVQYCIINKLRTPLGKAQDTFTKIEAALKSRALDAQLISKSPQSKDLLQIQMLLFIMENLDKLMYNAYDGCATRLYITPKQAKTFFKTNKTTCLDWMNRNRKSLMMIALRSGDFAAVWRNGQELLRDMISKVYWQEIEFILAVMVQALIHLGSPDAITGLYIWAKEVCATKYSWIKCAVEEAHGRYETALEEYTNLYSSLHENSSDSVKNESSIEDFINRRILECYLSLGHYDAAVCWSENYKPTQRNVFTSNVDLSYLKYFTSFEYFDSIDASEDAQLSWDKFSLFHQCQKNLLSVSSQLMHNSDLKAEEAITIIQGVYKKTSSILTTTALCTPSPLDTKMALLHRSAYSLLSVVNKEDKFFKWIPSVINSKGDMHRIDCSTLVYALSWIKASVELTPNHSNSSKDAINELNFVAAKAARKQQNLKLAQNLLLKYAMNACGIPNSSFQHNNYSNIIDISRLITALTDSSVQNVPLKEHIKFHYEGSKLLNAVGDTRTGIDVLLKCVSNLNNSSFPSLNLEIQELWSKCSLTLVKYLQSDSKYLEHLYSIQSPSLISLVNSCDDEVIWSLSPISQSESIVGKLVALTANKCPFLAKAYFSLGAWGYRWGRRLIDLEEGDKTVSEKIIVEEGCYSFYKMAANAYFKFLHLNGSGCEDSNVTATLRLLRLIVKHAPELREILEDGLSKTPTAPWKSIILQLFARLGHPEPYVRRSISDLLCRIGQDSPHLIVFPAVAGSLTSNDEDLIFNEKVVDTSTSSFDVDGDVFNEDEDDDDDDEKQDTSIMQNCYAALVETLTLQNPELIAQTKTFIHELRRITILWDELWIGTLIGHIGEMKKQVANLEDEISKVHKNTSLSKEEKDLIITDKHKVFFRKIVYLLEQTQIITNETPETPHENWFQRTFSKAISNALKSLKNPTEPSKPQQSLLIYQQLIQLLQKKALQWSSGRSQLIMDTISPVLASLEKTVIPMPGVDPYYGSVTIERVCKTVHVLHTKTKPKKIVFQGSDGKLHTYLFKGHEDLHLDERIMQFLTIVNKMLAKHLNNKSDKALFRARNYSVTPLGTKSGLIQWVDGGSALYGFYKRWMLNRDTSIVTQKQVPKANPPPNDNLYKPSEIFAKKLTSKGITTSNRNEWPKSVLVQILQELIQETPGDLISKELWCSSTNAHEFWKLTQAFTHSNAVMCMTGYIIGLGDRHLDNVLVDLSTGEVIHIDYNVCFEKGRTLRVPERVPCRLTNNIVNAFGLTGVEGTFRISCEHVIRVLRKGRETLLTLLEAFLYDPLIDWTPGHEEGYTGAIYGGGRINALRGKSIPKQQMEKENTKAMLKIRVAETKFEWIKVKEKVLSFLVSVEDKIKEIEDLRLCIMEAKREALDIVEQRNLIQEAMKSENHALFSLPSRYREYTKVRMTISQAKEDGDKKTKELKTWFESHDSSLKLVCSSELTNWITTINQEFADENGPVTVSPVVDFLQSAGQTQLIRDCERAESDLITSLQHCRMTTISCLEALINYAKIVQYFPPSYKTNNRNFTLNIWLEELKDNLTEAKCEQILQRFHKTYRLPLGFTAGDLNFNPKLFATIFSYLKTSIEDVNAKLLKAVELQQVEQVTDETRIKNNYADVLLKLDVQVKQDGLQSQFSALHSFITLALSLTKRMFHWEKACQSDLAWVLCHYPPAAREDESPDCIFFLNEMESFVAEFVVMLQTIQRCCPDIKSAITRNAAKTMKATHNVYSALVELNFNFQSIILPETLKLLQGKDASTLEAISKLETLFDEIGGIQYVDNLIKSIEMNVTPVEFSSIVSHLKTGFESILNTELTEDSNEKLQVSNLTSGQMLLIGFNAIFTKLDDELENLLSCIEKWTNSKEFLKIDLIADAKNLMKKTENVQLSCFLEQLKVMYQVFSLCISKANFLDVQNERKYINGDLLPLTHSQMIESVQFHIGKYVQKKLAGLASMTMGFAVCEMIQSFKVNIAKDSSLESTSLEYLCNQASTLFGGQHFYDQNIVTSINNLVVAWEDAWQKQHRWKQFQRLTMMHKVTLDMVKMDLVRRQWWHEDAIQELQNYPFPGTETLITLVKPTRVSVMNELRKTMQTLLACKTNVLTCQERYSNYTSSIIQRLKWATGANQALNPLYEQCEALIAARNEKCNFILNLGQKIVNVTESIVHFESLHTKSPETLALENSFVSLVNRCLKACMQAEKSRVEVTPAEEKLWKLMTISNKADDEFVITEKWLLSAFEKTRVALTTMENTIEAKNASLALLWTSFYDKVSTLKPIINSHNVLLAEVKHLIRILTKLEERELGSNNKLNGPVNQYYLCHRKFVENLFKLLKELEASSIIMNESESLKQLELLKGRVRTIRNLVSFVYDELLNSDGSLHNDNLTDEDLGKKLNKELFLFDSSVVSIEDGKNGAFGNERSSKHPGMERNTYATNVWKRVKMKLDGKDPDPSKRTTIAEQVDYIIKESMDIENLALMYEGWTSWV